MQILGSIKMLWLKRKTPPLRNQYTFFPYVAPESSVFLVEGPFNGVFLSRREE